MKDRDLEDLEWQIRRLKAKIQIARRMGKIGIAEELRNDLVDLELTVGSIRKIRK